MRVVITGASGFIGSALGSMLRTCGDEVRPLGRGVGPGSWDPATGRIDASVFEGADAVVHLAGETISGRWTAAKKERIRRSRVEGTGLLATTLAEMQSPPPVLLSGSAIGFYGDRDDEVLTESSAAGSGFFPDVVSAWEAATAPAEAAGLRVAHLRTALVFSRAGGSFPRMLLPFRMGVGGRIGTGRQFWSWITLEDTIRAIGFLLDRDISGPINLAAPDPIRNSEMTEILGEVMGRPAVLPAPAFGLKALLGNEFAEEVLLGSQRVVPDVLQAAGFEFHHPTLREALESVVAASARAARR
jgi:uncharacterized protein (TIGR01777 family)